MKVSPGELRLLTFPFKPNFGENENFSWRSSVPSAIPQNIPRDCSLQSPIKLHKYFVLLSLPKEVEDMTGTATDWVDFPVSGSFSPTSAQRRYKPGQSVRVKTPPGSDASQSPWMRQPISRDGVLVPILPPSPPPPSSSQRKKKPSKKIAPLVATRSSGAERHPGYATSATSSESDSSKDKPFDERPASIRRAAGAPKPSPPKSPDPQPTFAIIPPKESIIRPPKIGF